MTDLRTVRVTVIKIGRNNTGNFRGRGQGKGNFRGYTRGKGRGRGKFDKSPNVIRPRVASKTVDKDKMRCHYCNEYGHFIRECSKKNRDENKTGHFNGVIMDYNGVALFPRLHSGPLDATISSVSS